jgi:peptidoglycan L-alanyl-D-glutamate endopeptidase CwlK
VDSVSERNLATLDPALAEKIRTAAAEYEKTGSKFCVYDGYRTAAQEDALYEEGRTKPGKIVTMVRGGHSMHNYGMAADIVPFLAATSHILNWNPASAQYKAMVKALKDQGLVWGGDWVHFKDLDHFQIAGIPPNPTPQMVSDLESGVTLQAIWDKAARGEYA